MHYPFIAEFANPDDEAAQKSYNYVLNSAKYLKLFGGNRLVFHPAAQYCAASSVCLCPSA